MTRVRGYFVVARWMDGGWRQTSRSTSAYILRAMYGEREDKCDLIIFTQCYLLREAYLCALCVYLVIIERSTALEEATGYVPNVDTVDGFCQR